MTGIREEALKREKTLERVLCIHYSVQFKKDTNKAQVQALIDSESEVNVIHLAFAKQLGLPIIPTNVMTQKIDGTILDTYEIIVAAFLVKDKANLVRFFEETFLVTNVSPEVVLGMYFLILIGAVVDFSGRELWWRVTPPRRCSRLPSASS